MSSIENMDMKHIVTKILPRVSSKYRNPEGEAFGTLFQCKQTHLCFLRIFSQLSYLNGNLAFPEDIISLVASQGGTIHSYTYPISLPALFLHLRPPAPVLRFSCGLTFFVPQMLVFPLAFIFFPYTVSLCDFIIPFLCVQYSHVLLSGPLLTPEFPSQLPLQTPQIQHVQNFTNHFTPDMLFLLFSGTLCSITSFY